MAENELATLKMCFWYINLHLESQDNNMNYLFIFLFWN